MTRMMTSLLSIVLLLAGSLHTQTAAQHTGKTVLVKKGTILELTNLQPIDQATTKVGDRISLRLIRPLVIDGIALLPEGAVLYATVTKVHKKIPDCWHSNGWVDWKPDRISFPDKSTVKDRAVGTVRAVKVRHNPERRIVVAANGALVGNLDDLERNGLQHKGRVGQKIGIALLEIPSTILLSPLLLAEAATSSSSRCQNTLSGMSPIPEGTTIVVAISKDHRIRM